MNNIQTAFENLVQAFKEYALTAIKILVKAVENFLLLISTIYPACKYLKTSIEKVDYIKKKISKRNKYYKRMDRIYQ